MLEDPPMLDTLRRPIIAFLTNEDGPTSMEYILLLILVVVICITAIMAALSTRHEPASHSDLQKSTLGSGRGTTTTR